MQLDKQIAAVLQQFREIPEPDYSQVDAVQYRQFSDNLLPAIPGDPMSEVRELRVAGAEGELEARLYRPLEQDDLPLLVYFHGGGFVMGNLDTHDNLCRSLARQCEAVVVSVAYRLAPEHKFPAAPLDCYAATCWLVEHATALGFDGSRLAVAGDSAGGNLALAVSQLAAQRKGPKIGYQCLFYPVTDAACDSQSFEDFAEGYLLSAAAMRWFWQQYLQEAVQADDPLASPLRAENLADLPPTTLITAGFDPLMDEGEALAACLRDAGVPIRLRRCEGMVHGFISMAPFVEAAAQALTDACADVRGALR
ncbi:alpha/beta hydrolase [Pseudomonas vancouverensis]|uniref:Alpha/beta hydrolase n=1 Tax=Pseudomonas vancouverensis TaxID=95300 RepID=A0A1H2P027_PSEVA|nr:alpha/beta hydrolase [Pseudomonas vancouverensis]KAB0496616.1 alpha/beta hydrolase [Pseudomonas vancouverensis]TDB56418.1 alpha/beta hydrolase [Pseudomonas vancouverensis]SDV10741.1 acetyl esterase [Pseudomonas vancouverensis]